MCSVSWQSQIFIRFPLKVPVGLRDQTGRRLAVSASSLQTKIVSLPGALHPVGLLYFPYFWLGSVWDAANARMFRIITLFLTAFSLQLFILPRFVILFKQDVWSSIWKYILFQVNGISSCSQGKKESAMIGTLYQENIGFFSTLDFSMRVAIFVG